MKYPPVHYHDYLGLDKILSTQNRRSEEFKNPAHDEMLFMVVHQTYELWFKQMLFELDSVLQIFSQSKINESIMSTAVSRLERIVEIQRYINGQIDILETMTSLDFLEFREYLYPASGFQSFQWRSLETQLGLKTENRLAYNDSPFYNALNTEQQKWMKELLDKPSLFDLVEKWLERTPFLDFEGFNFWESYKKNVLESFESEREVIQNNPRLSPEEKTKNLAMSEGSLKTFEALFDENKYKDLQKQDYFRLSYKAIHAALLIQLYRDEPILQMPFRLLQSLINIDELMTQWRYRHSLMVHRMLGRRIGTGGSSGHEYLKSATDKHKIFTDFFNLATFLIPRSKVPKLPAALREKMGYRE